MTDPCSIFTHGYFVDDVLTRDETLAVFEWGWFDSLVAQAFKQLNFDLNIVTKLVAEVMATNQMSFDVAAITLLEREVQVATMLGRDVSVATKILAEVKAATVVTKEVNA